MSARLRRAAIPVVALAALVAIWDVALRVFDVKPYIMPSPGAAVGAIHDDWDVLRPLLRETLKEVVLGFLLGALIGFVLAVAMGQSSRVRRGLYPVLVASQTIPIVALAAPLVLLLGFGLAPKLVLIALWVFFPVVVNVLDGLAAVDRDLLTLARVMGGGRARTFALIELPATLTPLFSALKLGAAYAVTAAIIGEWTATITRGLGTYLLQANARLDAAGVYGATILLTAIGIGGFLLVWVVERLVTPWRTRTTVPRLRRSTAQGGEP